MPDRIDPPPVPLRDVRALADVGLDPAAARAAEDRARRTIAAQVAAATATGTAATAAGTAGRRRSRRLSRRSAGLLAVGAVLVGGTAIAATTPWSPQLGDARRGQPTVATTPVPADQTAALAVLRREQNDADRGPRVTAALRMLTPEAADGLRLDSVRLLAERPDGAMILVPSERAFKALKDGPDSRDQLCLIQSVTGRKIGDKGLPRPLMGMGMSCGSVRDVKLGRMMTGSRWNERTELSGLVPDGVAAVEVPLRGGPTLRAKVANNAFHIDQTGLKGHYNRNNVRWLDSSGQVIEWRRWRRPDLLVPGDR